MADIVTVAEIKAALGIVSSTADQTTFLDRMVALINETVRGYTGRQITSAQHEEVFYAPTKVTLREWPLITLDTVELDGSALVPADLRVDMRRGRIWRPAGETMDWGAAQKLRVIYTAGYALVPADIQEWAFLAIEPKWSAWADSRGLEPGGAVLSSVKAPDGNATSYATAANVGGSVFDLPDFSAGAPLSALDRYRDPTPAASDEYSLWLGP